MLGGKCSNKGYSFRQRNTPWRDIRQEARENKDNWKVSTAFRKGESPTKLNAVCQKVDEVDREPADREDDHLSIHEQYYSHTKYQPWQRWSPEYSWTKLFTQKIPTMAMSILFVLLVRASSASLLSFDLQTQSTFLCVFSQFLLFVLSLFFSNVCKFLS